PREQEGLHEERVQRRDVHLELRGPETRLQADDLRVRRADEHRGHHGHVRLVHYASRTLGTAPPGAAIRRTGWAALRLALRPPDPLGRPARRSRGHARLL